jgi:TM2 domain-containing membrane protein YozV
MSSVRTTARRRRVSPLAAWLLWLFLGWLGMHRLYLGHRVYGLIIAAANVLLLATIHVYWLPFAVAWWAVEGVLLFVALGRLAVRPEGE